MFAELERARFSSDASYIAPILTMSGQTELDLGFESATAPPTPRHCNSLAGELAAFNEFGEATRVLSTQAKTDDGDALSCPTYVNEFWTSKQRAAHRLHEISYRACFKPQLPRFFIGRLTEPGDAVYDPFMGRGTTPLEAAFMGRVPMGNDINPLSKALLAPRLAPPRWQDVEARTAEIDFSQHDEFPEDLLVFYHPDTLREICALKRHLLAREASGEFDDADAWIRMIALNRLTGHSPGFFSVYTLPPNQAVSVKSQIKINERRNQTPPHRDVPKLILKKSRSLLGAITDIERQGLNVVREHSTLLTGKADKAIGIPDESVSLVVTSPPFLDMVDYAGDNWLRCWFIGVDPAGVEISVPKNIETWRGIMTGVFSDLKRVLKPGGHVAFEVGEVRGGKVLLEQETLPCGIDAGLEPVFVMINDQQFTKTANCWGVDNQAKGTNTNRIVVFRKG